MSSDGLKDWLPEKQSVSSALIVAVASSGLLWFFGLGPRMSTVEERIAGVASDITEVKGDVDRIDSRLTKLGDDITGLKVDFATLKANVDNINQASIVKRVIVQQGQFTAENRVPDSDPPAFKWQLVVPIEPATGAEIQVVPDAPLPGVAITAELADDGRSCVMTLHGRVQASGRTLPIGATMTIKGVPASEKQAILPRKAE